MRSGQGSGYDVLKVWRDHADDVRGLGIDSGHFIPEEQPDRVYAALKEFFSVSKPASASGTRPKDLDESQLAQIREFSLEPSILSFHRLRG